MYDATGHREGANEGRVRSEATNNVDGRDNAKARKENPDRQPHAEQLPPGRGAAGHPHGKRHHGEGQDEIHGPMHPMRGARRRENPWLAAAHVMHVNLCEGEGGCRRYQPSTTSQEDDPAQPQRRAAGGCRREGCGWRSGVDLTAHQK